MFPFSKCSQQKCPTLYIIFDIEAEKIDIGSGKLDILAIPVCACVFLIEMTFRRANIACSKQGKFFKNASQYKKKHL